MDKFELSLLLAAGAPSILMLICLTTAILAFLRRTELGSAALEIAGLVLFAVATLQRRPEATQRLGT